MSEHLVDSLYRRYRRAVYARCRRILADPATAEDMTQEVFERVVAHADAVPGDLEALMWLHRVTTNCCLSELRKRKVRSGLAAAREDRRADPGDQRATDVDLVHRLLARVPERVSASAWLYYVDGMSQEEVGRALGLSRRTIINYLQHFRVRALTFVRREG